MKWRQKLVEKSQINFCSNCPKSNFANFTACSEEFWLVITLREFPGTKLFYPKKEKITKMS